MAIRTSAASVGELMHQPERLTVPGDGGELGPGGALLEMAGRDSVAAVAKAKRGRRSPEAVADPKGNQHNPISIHTSGRRTKKEGPARSGRHSFSPGPAGVHPGDPGLSPFGIRDTNPCYHIPTLPAG